MLPGTRLLEQDPDGTCARRLAGRLRERYIGSGIARSILALVRELPGAEADLDRSRARWQSSGGFVEAVTAEQVSAWIASPAYLVAEASPPGAEFRAEAQAVFTLPSDGWVVPLLEPPGDEITSPALLDRILDGGPGASAWIDYLSARPGSSGGGLAGLARYAGMLELIERYPALRQVAGTAFAVQGIETGGRRFLLADLGQAPVVNSASIRAIEYSRRCPARRLGIWRNGPPVPVEVDGEVHNLLVDWHVFVRLLEEVQPSQVQTKAR